MLRPHPWEGRVRGTELASEGTEATLSGRFEGDQLILQASGADSIKATRC